MERRVVDFAFQSRFFIAGAANNSTEESEWFTDEKTANQTGLKLGEKLQVFSITTFYFQRVPGSR